MVRNGPNLAGTLRDLVVDVEWREVNVCKVGIVGIVRFSLLRWPQNWIIYPFVAMALDI